MPPNKMHNPIWPTCRHAQKHSLQKKTKEHFPNDFGLKRVVILNNVSPEKCYLNIVARVYTSLHPRSLASIVARVHSRTNSRFPAAPTIPLFGFPYS